MVDGLINFNQFEITTPIIKVIGVGGGGGNAVEYMYRQGICDVISCCVIPIRKYWNIVLFRPLFNWGRP